jgi:hypothetical protein
VLSHCLNPCFTDDSLPINILFNAFATSCDIHFTVAHRYLAASPYPGMT